MKLNVSMMGVFLPIPLSQLIFIINKFLVKVYYRLMLLMDCLWETKKVFLNASSFQFREKKNLKNILKINGISC